MAVSMIGLNAGYSAFTLQNQNLSSLQQNVQQRGASNRTEEMSDPNIRMKKLTGQIECQTCKNRKYQDGSADPGVSFKSPAHIDPGSSAAVVMSHEQEHVRNESAKAASEDRKVVSQTVTLQTSICPECGRVYVSGGVTRTVTKTDNKDYFKDNYTNLMQKSFGASVDVKV